MSREFKADNPFLRPGSLLSLNKGGVYYNVLFLHTDSGRTLKDYENRQRMFESIFSLKDKLKDLSDDGDARMIVLGDLNTMGRKKIGASPAIDGEEEIAELKADAESEGMTLLKKNHKRTWARVNNQGKVTLSSDLDHVIASHTLTFGALEGEPGAVKVRGWVEINDPLVRRNFIEDISDHSSIELTIVE